jgi:hypothetical protein
VSTQLEAGRANPALNLKGRLFLRVARPRLLDPEACAADQAVVSAVTRALDAAVREVLDEPDLAQACLGPWADDQRLMDLFRLPSGYPQTIAFGRYDGVRGPDGLRILEFNGGLPGGIVPTTSTGALLASWPPFTALQQEFDVTVPDLPGAMVDAIVEVWHAFGGSGDPRLCFVVPAEFADYVAAPLAALLGFLRARGLEYSVCDPGELVRRDGAVHDSQGRVDVAIRVFFTSMVGDLGDRLDGLVEAVRAGELCMITSFRAGLMGHKSLFAVVTDPGIDLDLPDDVRALARAHLPWTRILGTVETTGPDGEPIDLTAYAAANRERLVLKPAEGTGGAGVMLGWEQEPQTWQDALDGATDGVWIIQERVPLTSEDFPVIEDGFPTRTFQDDHNPLVFNDTIGGYFVRVSETGGITNMTTGDGTVVPTFFVEPRVR